MGRHAQPQYSPARTKERRKGDPSSGCAWPAPTRRERVATVALRRCSRWPPGPALPMRQKVTGGVVRSSAGGRRLRRGHEAVALDGPDEPGEVPLDVQPRDQGCAATARRAPRSASLRRLVGTFAPERLVAIRPLLGVWHSRTCGECHTPKSQKLRPRPCWAKVPTKFRSGFRALKEKAYQLSQLRVQQAFFQHRAGP